MRQLNNLANRLRSKRQAERGIRSALKCDPVRSLTREQVEALLTTATKSEDKATAALCRTWLAMG